MSAAIPALALALVVGGTAWLSARTARVWRDTPPTVQRFRPATTKDSASTGGADSPAGAVPPPGPPAGHPDLHLDTNLTLAAEMFPQFSKRPK